MVTSDKSPSRKRSGSNREFLVQLRGYPDEHRVLATSASAARYASYRHARDVGIYRDFLLFMRDTRVRRPNLVEVRP